VCTSTPETDITQCRLGNGDITLSVRTNSEDVRTFVYVNNESVNIQSSRDGKNDSRITIANWDDTSEIEIHADTVTFSLGPIRQQSKSITGFANTIDPKAWADFQQIDAKTVFDGVKQMFDALCKQNNLTNPFSK
jgi:hypothetical protein